MRWFLLIMMMLSVTCGICGYMDGKLSRQHEIDMAQADFVKAITEATNNQ